MADKEMSPQQPTTSSVVAAYDWGALGHVVDVGGGDGTLMVALLNEYPALRGTVVDLPDVAEDARKTLDAAGLADRGDVIAGDFFGTLPDGAEGYLLCSVLHQWSDEEARTILRNCASAAAEDGAVFVIETVPEQERPGGERDIGELTVLAESADLTVAAVHTAGAVAILELALP
jgi:O-methyltransferase